MVAPLPRNTHKTEPARAVASAARLLLDLLRPHTFAILAGIALSVAALPAQQVCPPTPTYGVCDIVVELTPEEAAVHPNPYLSVDLRAELRSPKAKTTLAVAFWDGGRRMVLRFAPTDPGTWDFRLSGNLARLQNKLGQVQVTESTDAGFLVPANVHHWRYTESLKAHLWMGDTFLDFASAPESQFRAWVEARAKQKFTHARGLLLDKQAFSSADQPNAAYFQQLDKRIQALNGKGLFVDLILARDPVALLGLFSGWQQRERFLRYVVSRYSPFHLSWEVFQQFEGHAEGRNLLKEAGSYLKQHDVYKHPRSTGAMATAGPAVPDQWMTHIVQNDSEHSLGAIEHHVYPGPFVNTGFSRPNAAETDFLRDLWVATITGQYPVAQLDPASGDTAQSKILTAWFDFFARTRYWELEPYYDVDGGRALALPGVEYIVYIEKPGPVEMLVEKHGYDVFWFNPMTGELQKEKKEFKAERYMGEPPSKSPHWVLHLSREGRKEGMLRSYKFESRPNLMQEIEQNPTKAPFEIVEPALDTISLAKPPKYAVRVKRETRGTRAMQYLWTGEVPTEGRGYRVLGTGAEGVLRLPPEIATQFPAVFNLRIYAINAVGKVYSVDRVLRLTR